MPFELDRQPAILKTVTNRSEHHGDDEKAAATYGFRITDANTILDRLSPTLRKTLYTKPEGQDELPGIDESTPLLRTRGIDHLVFNGALEGWTLEVDWGINEDAPITFGGCKVDGFKVFPKEGGSVELALRVGTSDIDADRHGKLAVSTRQELTISLRAPTKKDDATTIDGTTDAFLRDHPNAGKADLLGDAGGGPNDDPDNEGSEPDLTPESALAAAVAKPKRAPIAKQIARADKKAKAPVKSTAKKRATAGAH